MPVNEIDVLTASDSEALDSLIARCAHAAKTGNDAASRAYLSGIFEVLADGQHSRYAMPISARSAASI
jgi:hypothetical protein